MQRRVPGVPVSDAEKARLHELGLVRRAEEPPPPATDKADRRGLLSRCLPTLLSLRAVVAALLVWNMALHYALKDAHAQLAAAPACNASNASAAYALLEEELLHDSEESLSRFIAGATREAAGGAGLKDRPRPGWFGSGQTSQGGGGELSGGMFGCGDGTFGGGQNLGGGGGGLFGDGGGGDGGLSGGRPMSTKNFV